MKIVNIFSRNLGISLLVFAVFLGTARASEIEDEVLAQMNFIRVHPADFAEVLKSQARWGIPGEPPTMTGPTDQADLQEAIAFLERQRPLRPLEANPGLARAAMAHVRTQSESGAIGHDEPDGTTFIVRLHRADVWAGVAGENISYGHQTARGVLTQLIVDTGIPSRGHRLNIFDPAYEYAGVACGPHRAYGFMCVIDYAGALVQR
jgi:uncharacterized protein YkwD